MDLWTIASEDHEGIAREAALARADAELEGVMPFLLASRTPQEFEHRALLAEDSLTAIAARNDLYLGDLMATARRRFELYREALTEGTDPLISLIPLLNGGGDGSGPEKPDVHSEGPDFSGSYSEVPTGPLSGPSPQVTRPRPEAAAPVQEATGSLRRRADSSPSSMMMSPYMPPDLGTGNGSVDMGVSDTPGGLTPSIPAGSNAVPGGATAPVGQVTSSRDPVRSKVLQVTAVIARANPGYSGEECERVARKVVSRYLREADLADSAISNGPMSDGGGSGGDGSSGGGGHGGAVKDMLAGQGLRSMLPGGAGAAGEAAGAAGLGELAELAPLAVL
jgi:hypothetical protein